MKSLVIYPQSRRNTHAEAVFLGRATMAVKAVWKTSAGETRPWRLEKRSCWFDEAWVFDLLNRPNLFVTWRLYFYSIFRAWIAGLIYALLFQNTFVDWARMARPKNPIHQRLLHLQSGTCMATAYETCTGKEVRRNQRGQKGVMRVKSERDILVTYITSYKL